MEKRAMKNFDVKEQEKTTYLSLDEASQLLRVSKSKLYKMVSRREIPHMKFGRRTLFQIESLHEFLSAHRVEVVTVPN